jgi:putative membrane protein
MTLVDRVHPNPIARIAVIIFFLTLISFGMAIAIPDLLMIGLLILWAIGGLAILSAYLSTRFITLDVKEDEVVYIIGVLSVRRKHIPYAKITDVSMQQSFIERIFGLGTLEIDTAGGPGTEIMMPSMPLNTLQRVMDEIKEEAKNYRNMGGR